MSYPFKTVPVIKNYIWGGRKLAEVYGRRSSDPVLAESWELSVHRDGPSRIAGGDFDGRLLSEVLAEHPEFLGARAELPILVKLIDSADNLSVQVHPDDAYARAHEGDNGKTEMWYILDAEPGCGIYCGLKRALTREELAARVADQTIEEALNFIPVQKGDCYLIEAGTLHAIGRGLTLCEIQENSNVTYRVYDYGRVGKDGKPRELHVQKALEVASLSAFSDPTGKYPPQQTEWGTLTLLVDCPYFKTSKAVTSDEAFLTAPEESFLALHILAGEGVLASPELSQPFKKGDTFFLPAGVGFVLPAGTEALLITA